MDAPWDVCTYRTLARYRGLCHKEVVVAKTGLLGTLVFHGLTSHNFSKVRRGIVMFMTPVSADVSRKVLVWMPSPLTATSESRTPSLIFLVLNQ